MRVLALTMALVLLGSAASAQSGKHAGNQPAAKQDWTKELARLRQEYVKAAKEYRASLDKLAKLYQPDIARAESRLAEAQQLFKDGIISRRELEATERALASARGKLTEVEQQISTADTQIANALVESEDAAQMARARGKGSLTRTIASIRFNGGGPWALSDSWKVQQFYQQKFARALPVAAFGQSSIHDQWRLDHRNAMDVSVGPDSPEGMALMQFLEQNGIPFSAFRVAIPGTATGPHIHIGRPSHRY